MTHQTQGQHIERIITTNAPNRTTHVSSSVENSHFFASCVPTMPQSQTSNRPLEK